MKKPIANKTVGEKSLELSQKKPESLDPIELQREMLKDYEKHIEKCIKRGKRDLEGDFYVEVLTKKERIMTNVLRNFFITKKFCPTPTWDQTLYKYRPSVDSLDFLWTIPSRDTCELLLQNQSLVPLEELHLLQFIKDFYSGKLDEKAKEENGEKKDSILLENN